MKDALCLIPDVLSCERQTGYFELRPESSVFSSGDGAVDVAGLLASYWRVPTGYPLNLTSTESDHADVRLICGNDTPDDEEFPDESYTLEIFSGKIQLTAPHAAGLARGVQTLRQLMPPPGLAGSTQSCQWQLPCLKISDRPRFPWRGMHLDVARHFFPVEEVCRFIDLIALHRFNRLHLHLTDDQGWRVEIPEYPLLTEVGAWRSCTVTGKHEDRPRSYDNVPHGGFYTLDDLRHIVDFAARRHIRVVPEIDMPGHMVAAIVAYPELGNGSRVEELRCHWGISNEILNVEPETLDFVRTVLTRVMEVFPGRYIHIGGDEVPKYEWENSRRVQARMLEYGVGNEVELQGWFNAHVAGFLAEQGRRLIGWDEILESGLPPDAVVMNWRDEKHAVEAARAGHDVIAASSEFTYFDFYQSDPICEEPIAIGREITVGRVYAFDPVPLALEPEYHHRILGGQGQLWTEFIKTRNDLDYMAFPRVCALAEILWLPQRNRTCRDFLNRLREHRRRLDVLGVNAHPLP